MLLSKKLYINALFLSFFLGGYHEEYIYPPGQWDLIFIIYKILNYKIIFIIVLWLYLLEPDYDTSGVYSTAESTANLVGI